jgi:GT2 family glycosyltransferase
VGKSQKYKEEKILIILARNNLALTRACLSSALKQTANTRVLVINNASSDETANWLRHKQTNEPKLVIMSAREQMSVAAAWNAGLDYAWRHGCGQALVANNDTELRPDTYENLRLMMIPIRQEDDGTRSGLVSGISVDTLEQRDQNWNPSSTSHPDFSCFMIARWCHQRVRFDESYLISYVEDTDWHVRAHRAGIRCINTGLPFLHTRSSTLKNADEAERKRICEQADKNRALFKQRYGCLPGTHGYERLFSL